MGGGRLLLLLVLLLLLLTWGCASPGRERPVSATDHGERGGKRIERGFASWYGDEFHGRPTASGEIFDMHGISAAHRTLPFGTVVEVTNLNNGRRLDVRINDRGPFVRGRILDVSKAAAAQLDMVVAGIARVELRIVDRPAAARRRAAAVEVVLVQAGAFLEKARARALAERLYHVDRRFRVYSTGGWHRVQARGLDLEQAEELRRRLTTAGVEAVVAAER